jgi:anti-sigma regulatory factor (Ser/Thr protein kinase)
MNDALLSCDVDLRTLVDVRHAVRRAAAAEGVSGRDLYLFVVAVNEITTNAVRHGGGTGHLRLWRADGRLFCQVVDRGPGVPPGRSGHQRPAPDTLGGRGLWLARQGCQTLTIDSGTEGTAVTLILPLG